MDSPDSQTMAARWSTEVIETLFFLRRFYNLTWEKTVRLLNSMYPSGSKKFAFSVGNCSSAFRKRVFNWDRPENFSELQVVWGDFKKTFDKFDSNRQEVEEAAAVIGIELTPFLEDQDEYILNMRQKYDSFRVVTHRSPIQTRSSMKTRLEGGEPPTLSQPQLKKQKKLRDSLRRVEDDSGMQPWNRSGASKPRPRLFQQESDLSTLPDS
jgi:hypothetical protein